MMSRELTPTQREIMDRHRAFKAAIDARAGLLKPPAEPASFGIKGGHKPSPKALNPQSVPSQPDPPKPDPMVLQFTQKARNVEETIVWPVIPNEPVALHGSNPKIAQIRSAVCRYYGVTHTDLLSKSRLVSIVYARHVAMYLAKVLTGHSLPEIGRRLGNRDHTTILHGVRKIHRKIWEDKDLAHEVSALIYSITEGQQ